MVEMTMRDDGIDGSGVINLPPGFLFSPTDEELVLHFLYSKATSTSLLPSHPKIIPDLYLSLTNPWQLNGKALSSENQYYFFSKVSNDEKRITENGYWKEIGVAESIVYSGVENKKVGMKKYLVFQVGEGEGTETSWVMQEYHVWSSDTRGRRKHDQSWSRWVLCRVYEKNKCQQQQGVNCCTDHEEYDDSGTELSWLDEVYLSLDDDDLVEEEITTHV